MGIVDIEGPQGGRNVEAAETMFLQNAEGKSSRTFLYMGLIGLGLMALVRSGIISTDKLTIDGFGADFEKPHQWNR